MEFVSKSLEETQKIASDLALKIKPQNSGATILGLYGDLGSGKTTFMKYFARALGVKEEIQSPTFVIMKFFNLSVHSSFNKLIHIDAYRLDSGEELLKLGWQEIISDPKNLICLEWPDRVAEILPEHIMLTFEHGKGETERKISIA